MKRFFSALIAIGAVVGLLFLFSAPVNVHHGDVHDETHGEGGHGYSSHKETDRDTGDGSAHEEVTTENKH